MCSKEMCKSVLIGHWEMWEQILRTLKQGRCNKKLNWAKFINMKALGCDPEFNIQTGAAEVAVSLLDWLTEPRLNSGDYLKRRHPGFSSICD